MEFDSFASHLAIPSQPAEGRGTARRAYFTDLEPSAANLRVLYKKIRVPREKQEYVFWFDGNEGLKQLNDGKGRDKRIYYSPVDYLVGPDRQRHGGATAALQERFA